MASSLSKELVFLILQFLDDEKFNDSLHNLEKDSGLYFNMGYFEDIIRNGEWDEADKYLSGFTKFDDNKYSMMVFFDIRKQKYLEALERKDCFKAVEILRKDLKVVAAHNEDIYKDLTQLLTLDDFRENEELSYYVDTKSTREIVVKKVKDLIEVNPLFREKLQFPDIRSSRLSTLINQSLNWQHHLCKNPKPNPDIQTLYMDHTCGGPHGARAPSPNTNTSMGGVSKGPSSHQIAAPAPFHSTPAQFRTSPSGYMANLSLIPHPSTSVGHMSMAAPDNHVLGTSDPSATLKRPMTPTNNPAMGYPTVERVMKRPRDLGTSGEASSMAVTVVPGGQGDQSHTHVYSPSSMDNLPNKVIMTLNQGSGVKSMDFHPAQQILLLVGTSTGETTIWDLSTRKSLAVRKFEVWDLGACSLALQASLAADYTTSANRVKWSPCGLFFGAAFSKHIVHIYSYRDGDLRNRLEIEAHEGSVNDIGFAYPNEKLSFVTCGDDKVIKVWDALTGAKLFSFEGHEAPVYSVCPHQKKNIPVLFSVATDGRIKAWLYDNLGSRVDYDAPGLSSTTMAYSADGRRFFTCGTSKEGVCHLVEWNENEGVVKRVYLGLGKQSVGIVQFDTTKNQFLAAGDECVVKFWDMDGVDLLTTTDADGGLPASPCLKFSNEGMLLAVSTDDNGIKILANGDGRLLLAFKNRMVDPSSTASVAAGTAKAQTSNVGNYGAGAIRRERIVPVVATVNTVNDTRGVDGRPRLIHEPGDKSRVWKPTLINAPSECRSLVLPDNVSQKRGLASLIYTNSGGAILALACNAVHKLWKWPRNQGNVNGKATASVVPQLMQPSNGIPMINEISQTNPEEAISCFVLSNNDSYVLSASGGRISLFNLTTLKTLTKFMPPPPAATFLAFHPEDNNIIAIGRDDSSILIYNMRVLEVKAKLDGHRKRITGLAFSPALRVLVSAGADSQLCMWSGDGWEKLKSTHLRMPPGRVASPLADTRVQFHGDQVHVLVVHETQIAIYNAEKLECLKQWVPREVSGSITHATYSCDSQSIYASFQDGSVGVLSSSTLRLRCRIRPDSYLPANLTNPKPYPVVIAAHPSVPSQFAVGLTDGGVVVLEPNESEGQWGTAPRIENVGARGGTTSSSTGEALTSSNPAVPKA